MYVKPVNPTLSGNTWLTPQGVKTAVIKIRLPTETCYLETDRATFSTGSPLDLCLPCSAAAEDRVHFIAEYEDFSSNKQRYVTENEPFYRNQMAAGESITNSY